MIIADPGIPVPPIGYGGIERVVGLLAQEYFNLGHEVTILASKGSNIEGCIVRYNGTKGFPQSKWNRILAVIRTWKFLLVNHSRFDIVQNFGRLIYLLPILKADVKKIMCYQREIRTANISFLEKLSINQLFLTSCSKKLIWNSRLNGIWTVIHNPTNTRAYKLNSEISNGSPLIYLSRINRNKGCHIAIEIAKKTMNTLIIAGNIDSDEGGIDYFKKNIEPHIDGRQIIYVGEVNDTQKNHFLGKAKAMLFPILWEEPFGIVMIESMACGTPVIAFTKGAVDEVIDEGITGFKVRDEEEMLNAVYKIGSIDRTECRNRAIQRFDIEVIASNYLKLH